MVERWIVADEVDFREDLLSGEWYLIGSESIMEEISYNNSYKVLKRPDIVIFWAKIDPGFQETIVGDNIRYDRYEESEHIGGGIAIVPQVQDKTTPEEIADKLIEYTTFLDHDSLHDMDTPGVKIREGRRPKEIDDEDSELQRELKQFESLSEEDQVRRSREYIVGFRQAVKNTLDTAEEMEDNIDKYRRIFLALDFAYKKIREDEGYKELHMKFFKYIRREDELKSSSFRSVERYNWLLNEKDKLFNEIKKRTLKLYYEYKMSQLQ